MRRLAGWLACALWLTACDDASVVTGETGQPLSTTIFEQQVNPIFDASIGGKTCSAGGCHSVNGGAGGSFRIYPNAIPGSTQILANYYAAKAFVNQTSGQEATSKLLTEPLFAAEPHSGGDIFPNTSDPNYAIILCWIVNTTPGC